MIFDLQDATKNQKLIDAAKISEPQLLAGIDLDRLAIEKRKLNDQMNEGKSALQDKAFLHEDIDVRGQFQKSKLENHWWKISVHLNEFTFLEGLM